jgi:signal transduction histidine kinase
MLVERKSHRPVIAAIALAVTMTGAGVALLAAAGRFGIRAITPSELALTIGLFGALILWHRPSNRIGALAAVTGMLFGITVLAGGVLGYASARAGMPGALRQAALGWAWLCLALSLPWTLLLLWFPGGDFLGRGWKRFFVGAVVASVAFAVVGYLFSPPGARLPAQFPVPRAPAGTAGPLSGGGSSPLIDFADAFSLALPLVALAGLLQRYRHSGVVVREQIKWLLVGGAVAVLGNAVVLSIQNSGRVGHDVGVALAILVNPLPTAATTLAIFRYRLWEIDVLVSRALVYGVLWGVLSIVLLVPALATGLLVGGSSALAAVGLALLVTLAFQPVRARLERAAERIVYRNRPRGYALVTHFAEALRATVGVEELAPRLAEVLRSGLGASWAGVWVHVTADGGGALLPVASAGIDPGPAALLEAGTAQRLRSSPAGVLTGELPSGLLPLWPRTAAAAVVPLVVGEELVGLLACGERPGDALGERDHELLGLIAHEAALALRNLRLEAQLRERLALIEEQAGELRRSRQRLVGAQDEQRRRIERDLHDGVQQQLVALAARLRRASIATPADSHALLERLAGEAEEAVFALQELARGIFPSVLADQGLAAAVRTQAARMPMAIHVEAEPNLAGRRFERELEAALYFVALEALANIQKHAPGAAATVSLRSAPDARSVVLEVHDDGPGFERRAGSPGSGLQNMHDRVAAVGGELEIDSRPGAGTWLRAQTPITAPVISLQPDADSFR